MSSSGHRSLKRREIDAGVIFREDAGELTMKSCDEQYIFGQQEKD